MKVPKVSAIFLVFLLSVCFLPSPSLCDANAANPKIPNVASPAVNANSAETVQGPSASPKTNNNPAAPAPEKDENKEIAKIDDKINTKKSSAKPVLISAITTMAALAIASALGYGIYTKNKAKSPKEGEEGDASTNEDAADSEESNDATKDVEEIVSEIVDEVADAVEDAEKTE
ncbi:early transcribed membrane protein [Plasmodium vinckei brucechwatti]|uniref:Early transcribed membrane protein n=1 Tax=Plasmodium vinckei brucechwatti TaxID=119398 RepID=A0A6V7RT22_PLAVN|nr:early transcribed membrane protein [Plasmodium vinckei brucechwatti]